MNTARLKSDLRNLSYAYPVAIDDDYKSIIVKDFNLPPGYNYDSIPVLLKLPRDYPESPPGVGNAKVYVPSSLRFKGKKPCDFHEYSGPTKNWAWWCYEEIAWNPFKDDLVTFFELMRAHMTNPKTKGFF
ncbi:MAG: hypothetical protein KAI59_00115 [Planctomycetes bacterium]|nr:hypothetical protein [Planctomycetota bacterium]MCK5472406.1 hypothetical protein [Planctomycetota bacterium]